MVKKKGGRKWRRMKRVSRRKYEGRDEENKMGRKEASVMKNTE
jgi:hypothetical protein